MSIEHAYRCVSKDKKVVACHDFSPTSYDDNCDGG